MAVVVASERQCARCGSTERRPGGKGCAECHRTRERERRRAQGQAERDEGFEITPAIRAYLEAFDRYVLARKEGFGAVMRAAEADRYRTLVALRSRTQRKG